MALIGNRSVLNKSPGRFLNAGVATYRSEFSKHGMVRSAAVDPKAAIPYGHLSPSSWVLPRKAGGMSSSNTARIIIDSSGLAVGGITANGSSSITIAFADAYGQLIASASGTSSFTIDTNTPLLTASIEGIGAASFVVSGTATLGAEANISGASTITITVANATAFPLNDASPLRDASASFAFGGSLTPYAIGSMSGSTVDIGVVTNDSVASAVWSKVIEAGYSADSILRILAAHAAGEATGLEGTNPQFTGIDGVTVRIDGTYLAGTRTIDTLNGDV